MKRFLPYQFLILASLFLLACEEEKQVLLPEDLMVDVLSELHIADAYTERNSNPINYRNNLREDLYLEVLEKFELDEQTFRATYDFYTSHPYQMDTLYLKVIEKLETQLQGEKMLQQQQTTETTEEKTPPAEAPRKAPWQNHGNASQ